MTPKKYQSGETDITGRISKTGDKGVRAVLYEAAHIILTMPIKGGALKSWAGQACQARWAAEGKSCACQEAGGDPPPHAGGWRQLRRRQGCRGMSGPASSTMAPCSRPSTPLRAAYGGGLRPVLTATARGAFGKVGRGGETPFSRTKKLFAARCDTKGEALHDFRAG